MTGSLLAMGLAAAASPAVAHQAGGSDHQHHHRAGSPVPAPALLPQLAEVREALRKCEDPVAAVRDGYLSTPGCVEYPGGGMGVHFLKPALIGPTPDPFQPQILVYEPAGGEPLMPRELHHCDLHAWLFKDNPAGLFHWTNPTVGCADHAYALMEQPTATVAHHHHHRR